MKLVTFNYTNAYDNKSQVHINPAFVVSLRPADQDRREQTTIFTVCSTITVDGEIAAVAEALSGDYDPAQIKETG